MPRFGFSKKDQGDDEPKKGGLFGSRSKDRSPAPPQNNPYATPTAPPDPYTQAKINAGLMPGAQPTSTNGGHQSQQPSKNETSKAQQQSGYAPNRYGDQSGYGASGGAGNPYGGSSQGGYQARARGYGGLGPSKHADEELDQRRNDLFGAAPQRKTDNPNYTQNGPPAYSYEGSSEPADSKSYGAYGDRQLTAEEEEEQDVEAIKQQIADTKGKSLQSVNNIRDIARQTYERAGNTNALLGTQGERLYNTQKNLDLAQNQVTAAEDKTEELRRLNRSMFVPAHNPFTNKSRAEKQEQRILDNHHDERLRREEIREQSYRQNQRMQNTFRDADKAGYSQQPQRGIPKQRNLAARGKYQFEADEADDAVEDAIEDGLDDAYDLVKGLKVMSTAMGTELDHQNRMIDDIAAKSDAVDDRVVTQTARLKRIK